MRALIRTRMKMEKKKSKQYLGAIGEDFSQHRYLVLISSFPFRIGGYISYLTKPKKSNKKNLVFIVMQTNKLERDAWRSTS